VCVLRTTGRPALWEEPTPNIGGFPAGRPNAFAGVEKC